MWCLDLTFLRDIPLLTCNLQYASITHTHIHTHTHTHVDTKPSETSSPNLKHFVLEFIDGETATLIH